MGPLDGVKIVHEGLGALKDGKSIADALGTKTPDLFEVVVLDSVGKDDQLHVHILVKNTARSTAYLESVTIARGKTENSPGDPSYSVKFVARDGVTPVPQQFPRSFRWNTEAELAIDIHATTGSWAAIDDWGYVELHVKKLNEKPHGPVVIPFQIRRVGL